MQLDDGFVIRCIESPIPVHSRHSQNLSEGTGTWKIHLRHRMRIWREASIVTRGGDVKGVGRFFTTISLKKLYFN